MKALKAKEIANNGTPQALLELPYPIVYQDEQWTVYYTADTYYLQQGQGETYYLCQTVDQVREYIPNFKV